MPRNYSVKQTIEMVKANIKKAKESEDKSDMKAIIESESKEDIESTPQPKAIVTQTETISKDEIIKFKRPDEKPVKKWYQFWK